MQIATICHFYLCFLVLPVEDALTDGVPMVIFSGQVPTGAMGTDAFQEWTGWLVLEERIQTADSCLSEHGMGHWLSTLEAQEIAESMDTRHNQQ